jgi:hypothetical protein
MKPKEFIEVVFINDLEEIASKSPYISFAIMATGIEFLGKCLDLEAEHWNERGKSKINFEYAIKNLEAFEKYRSYMSVYKLWDSLRNGFSHSFVPKKPLTLSSRNELGHLVLHSAPYRLNLRCEDFYVDFKNACLEVIEKEFEKGDKMNRELLDVPE